MQILRRSLQRIVANPRIYNGVQAAFGAREVRRHVAPHLSQTEHKSLLDVGAGTGLYRSLVPDSARYIWQDIDPDKLATILPRSMVSAEQNG